MLRQPWSPSWTYVGCHIGFQPTKIWITIWTRKIGSVEKVSMLSILINNPYVKLYSGLSIGVINRFRIYNWFYCLLNNVWGVFEIHVVVYGGIQACHTLLMLHITLLKQWDSILIHASLSLSHYTADEEHGSSSWFFQYPGLVLNMSLV